MLSMSCSLASWAVIPAMASIWRFASSLSLSYSSHFFFAMSSWFFRFSRIASSSLFLRPSSEFCWLRLFSFWRSLFSASLRALLRSLTFCSCSLLSWRNFSFAWSIFSCFIASPSRSASAIIASLRPFRIIRLTRVYAPTVTIALHSTERITINIVLIKIYCCLVVHYIKNRRSVLEERPAVELKKPLVFCQKTLIIKIWIPEMVQISSVPQSGIPK